MTDSQQVAHDVSGGSGVTTSQPDLRDATFRQNDPPAPNQQYQQDRSGDFQFTAEQIEKARREEREKVQREKARLKELADAQKAELEELKQWREAKQAEELARQKKADKEARREAEKDLSAKEILAAREAEWEQRLNGYEQKFAQLEAKAALERQVMELKVYINQRVAEAQREGLIADQFVDYITGSTPEEVEASLDRAIQKTEQIKQEIAAERTGTPQPRGVSVATGPAELPSDLGGLRETGDQVDYTKLSLKEYLEKVRPTLGISGGGKGLFD